MQDRVLRFRSSSRRAGGHVCHGLSFQSSQRTCLASRDRVKSSMGKVYSVFIVSGAVILTLIAAQMLRNDTPSALTVADIDTFPSSSTVIPLNDPSSEPWVSAHHQTDMAIAEKK